ncbi:chromosomal replication initiator protein DnaA [Patescibacteria group bacterium]|nr:chromosomal replication initiator protein DnaA [Patescibacteria group bacterium]
MDKKQIWNIVLSELELLISKANFKTWLQNTYILSLENEGKKVIVGVPNSFAKSWLENKYHKYILEALRGATEEKVKEVVYKINADSNKKGHSSNNIAPRPQKKKTEESEGASANNHGLNPRYTFENFVVGEGSELAYAACQAVCDNAGKKYNPLFIYGGVGLGKTHLLQAVGHSILKKSPKSKLFYTNAEKFTNDFITAIGNGTMEKFKKFYRQLKVFLIDDIQFMTGKDRTQEEFFHTFNALYQEERQIIIASDRPPKEIPALQDRLTSRLTWGLIADIAPPGLETRIAILKAKCEEKEYPLSEEILGYLATHIQSNVRELEGALNKLIAYQEFHQQQELDLETVKNILSTLNNSKNKTGFVHPRQLMEVVANFYGLELSDMISSSRKKEFVLPRQITMYLMREENKASFPFIGKELGKRDHTTAMHACEKIKKAIDKDPKLKKEIDLIKERLYN